MQIIVVEAGTSRAAAADSVLGTVSDPALLFDPDDLSHSRNQDPARRSTERTGRREEALSREVYATYDEPPGTVVPVEAGIIYYAPEWRALIRERFERRVEEGAGEPR